MKRENDGNLLALAYLIDSKSKDLEIAVFGEVEASERLVICDSERRKGFVKVDVKPVDANVQVASEYQGDHRRREDPEIEEH